MPAAATQSAPQRTQTPNGTRQAPQNTKRGEEKPQASAIAKLRDLPQAAGIALMALLLVVSLFVGNARALQNAIPANFLRQGSVASIIDDRAAQARNAVTVAQRAFADEPQRVSGAVAQVNEALSAFEKANTVEALSRADQTLTSAVSDLAAAAGSDLSSEDATMLRRALDNFAEQGSFLRQEGRSYNEKARAARELYERLPTKFLLKQPGIYEGI